MITGATIAATAIGIIQSAFVVRTLRGELFGQLVLMQTTWQTIVLLTNFGTNINGMYNLATAISAKDQGQTADALSYLIKGTLLSNFLAAAGAVVLSFFLPSYVGLGTQTLLAFSLTGILSILTMPEICAMAVIQARRRMKLFSLLLIANAAIDLVCTVLLTRRFSVYGALVAPAAASALSAGWYWHFLRKEAASNGGAMAVLRRSSLRTNFFGGIWMALDRNIGTFYSILPYHIVNWLYGPAVTGSLRIASRLCEVAVIPQNAIATNAASLIPCTFARGDDGEAWRTFWNNVRLGGLLAVGTSLALLVFGRQLLGLVYGPTGEASAFLIPWLVPYVLIAALGPVGTMYRLMNLVPKAVLSRLFLTICTAAALCAFLPASQPVFAGIARSAFYLVSTTYLLWMVLRSRSRQQGHNPPTAPDGFETELRI